MHKHSVDEQDLKAGEEQREREQDRQFYARPLPESAASTFSTTLGMQKRTEDQQALLHEVFGITGSTASLGLLSSSPLPLSRTAGLGGSVGGSRRGKYEEGEELRRMNTQLRAMTGKRHPNKFGS